jgi:hypothetical protein
MLVSISVVRERATALKNDRLAAENKRRSTKNIRRKFVGIEVQQSRLPCLQDMDKLGVLFRAKLTG